MANLVWFRSDLRIHDNTALHHACKDPDEKVLAVFLLSPAQWLAHDWATVKVDLLLRTLADLSASLASKNIPVLIRAADPFSAAPAALLSLAREHHCTALFFNREYELNELRRDDAVRAAFESASLTVHPFDDQTVLPPGHVLTKESKPYTVFTPFKKAWIPRIREAGGPTVHPAPRKRPAMPLPPDPVPLELPQFTGLKRPDLWLSGETHASARLKSFITDRILTYKQTRDTPSLNGTSTLSPYLSIGAISPRQCLQAALDANEGQYDAGNVSAAHWISELVWREFYRHLIVAFPRLCMHRAFKPETEKIRWRDDDAGFQAWCAGRTGVPIVDAAQRQLLKTGWMHNRLRMVSAMFLTKDLFIDWRRGEKFFMNNLVDGDLAQNNGGWQWSASTGTDAAPYFRIFNPVSQSRTFDPDGTFIRKFVPELAALDADTIHEPGALPLLLRGAIDYPPRPIIDHAQARAHVMQAFRAL